ncbi:MAG: hypothetical protein ACR2RB_05255 [Gammaproteobacteria bacterium]
MILRILAAFVLIFLNHAPVRAAVHNITCVNDIYNSLSALTLAIGDTINISAGRCTLNTSFRIDKAVHVRGAGQQLTAISTNVDSPFFFNVSESACSMNMWELSGLELRNSFRSSTSLSGAIRIGGDCKRWRIHHITYSDIDSNNFVYVSGDTYGLIDHCQVDLTGKFGVSVDHSRWDGGTWGDASWSAAANWGTDEFVYVEDTTFTCRRDSHCFGADAIGGARVIFRHNTLQNTNISNHGTDSTRRKRSIRLIAVHDSTFNMQDTFYGTCTQIRGGTGVFYNNKITGRFPSDCLRLRTYRSDTNYEPWGQCDETPDFICLTEGNRPCTGRRDTSCPGGAGFCVGPVDNYPDGRGPACRDGVGTGQDSGLSSAQALEPVYIWGNEGISRPAVSIDLTENEDWYIDYDGPGCTAGVTTGVDADRCPTCTTGAGYWAKDTRKLYRCRASNSWSEYYSELRHPHPLADNDLPPDTSAPARPSGLTVN